MGLDEKFIEAREHYERQILDGIVALEKHHPFAAITLACCAIGFLSHIVHNLSDDDDTGTFFETTVREKLPEYRDYADPILQLRNGMVHEFRTGADLLHVYLSSELKITDLPRRDGDDVLLSVPHFVAAVGKMFDTFFIQADDVQKRIFTNRAFIHVRPLPDGLLRTLNHTWVANTISPAASGTAEYIFPDTFFPSDS